MRIILESFQNAYITMFRFTVPLVLIVLSRQLVGGPPNPSSIAVQIATGAAVLLVERGMSVPSERLEHEYGVDIELFAVALKKSAFFTAAAILLWEAQFLIRG